MNAIDILGSLLGGGRSSGGSNIITRSVSEGRVRNFSIFKSNPFVHGLVSQSNCGQFSRPFETFACLVTFLRILHA